MNTKFKQIADEAGFFIKLYDGELYPKNLNADEQLRAIQKFGELMVAEFTSIIEHNTTRTDEWSDDFEYTEKRVMREFLETTKRHFGV